MSWLNALLHSLLHLSDPSHGAPHQKSGASLFLCLGLRKARSPGILNTNSPCLLCPSFPPRSLGDFKTTSPAVCANRQHHPPGAVAEDCSEVLLCSPCLPGARDTWIFPALFLKISKKKKRFSHLHWPLRPAQGLLAASSHTHIAPLHFHCLRGKDHQP